MNSVATVPMGIKIFSSTLHHIVLEGTSPSCTAVDTSAKHAALETYLDQLRQEIEARPQSRAYQLVSTTTEFATCLQATSKALDLTVNGLHDVLANRLFRTEVDAEEKYQNLRRKEHGNHCNHYKQFYQGETAFGLDSRQGFHWDFRFRPRGWHSREFPASEIRFNSQ